MHRNKRTGMSKNVGSVIKTVQNNDTKIQTKIKSQFPTGSHHIHSISNQVKLYFENRVM